MRRYAKGKEPLVLDPAALEPDALREWVRKALTTLPQDRLAEIGGAIIHRLNNAGVDVPACVLLLGITARTTDELLPSDIAQLLRYLRINSPESLQEVAALLTQLTPNGRNGGAHERLAA